MTARRITAELIAVRRLSAMLLLAMQIAVKLSGSCSDLLDVVVRMQSAGAREHLRNCVESHQALFTLRFYE